MTAYAGLGAGRRRKRRQLRTEVEGRRRPYTENGGDREDKADAVDWGTW